MNKQIFKFFLPLISAVILIFCFPRFDLGAFAWVALIPLLWFIINSPPRTALGGGLLFGFVFHLYINSFVIVTLNQFLSMPLTIAAYLLLAIFLSLYYGIYAYLVSRLKEIIPAYFMVFLLPFLWVIMEYVRSLGLLGYTAGYIGYSQWAYTDILQISSVYGYWGIAFLIIFIQALLVMAIQNKLARDQIIKAISVWGLIFLIGLSAPHFFPVEKNADTKNIALIQANIPQEDILAGPDDNLVRYENLTREAFTQNENIDLVVWAETVLSLPLARGKAILPEIEQLSREFDTPFLYGAMVRENNDLYNSVVFYSPHTGRLQKNYKQYLVPIVEYFPYDDLLNRWLDLGLNLGNYTRGQEENIIYFNDRPLGSIICFESFFGNYSRKYAAAGAQYMFVLTNDGWLGDTHGLDQHAHTILIRAAEMGIGVTQVANTGITISADYTGEEILRSGIETEEILFLETDFSRRNTIYSILGEYFIYGSLLISLALIFFGGKIKFGANK